MKEKEYIRPEEGTPKMQETQNHAIIAMSIFDCRQNPETPENTTT